MMKTDESRDLFCMVQLMRERWQAKISLPRERRYYSPFFLSSCAHTHNTRTYSHTLSFITFPIILSLRCSGTWSNEKSRSFARPFNGERSATKKYWKGLKAGSTLTKNER